MGQSLFIYCYDSGVCVLWDMMAVTRSLIPSIIGHYFHNLTLSTLTNAYPSLCRIPKEGSLVMWVVAAIVLFLAIGREDRQIPQALQA